MTKLKQHTEPKPGAKTGLPSVASLASEGWWLGAELNRRHKDFQSSALPTELPSRLWPIIKPRARPLGKVKRKQCHTHFPDFAGRVFVVAPPDRLRIAAFREGQFITINLDTSARLCRADTVWF
jgi:hypothetical protein